MIISATKYISTKMETKNIKLEFCSSNSRLILHTYKDNNKMIPWISDFGQLKSNRKSSNTNKWLDVDKGAAGNARYNKLHLHTILDMVAFRLPVNLCQWKSHHPTCPRNTAKLYGKHFSKGSIFKICIVLYIYLYIYTIHFLVLD